MYSFTLRKLRILSVLVFALLGTSLISCGGTPGPPPPAQPAAPPGQAPTEPSSTYESPVLVGRIQTDDVKESSGLSASECQDALWTQNDSGNEALIFGLGTDGSHLGAWRVENAQNIDWESIASYKGPDGKCSLIIGDIGNNDETRTQLDVYRIPEPTLSPETAQSSSANPLRTEPAAAMKFSYPDGNSNAETLLVHPQTGDIYVVTKKESGPASVFKMKQAFGTGTAVTGEKVADVSVPSQPEGRVTGGSISPDGTRVMLCDLEGGYEFVQPEGATDPDAIWQQQPQAVDLGDRPQGEGVSYGPDGASLYASSEKKNAPLFLVKRST
jgi:hypothetical protein